MDEVSYEGALPQASNAGRYTSFKLRRHLSLGVSLPGSCSFIPIRKGRKAMHGDDDDNDDTMALPRHPVLPSRPGKFG